jgi:hypothetical protein
LLHFGDCQRILNKKSSYAPKTSKSSTVVQIKNYFEEMERSSSEILISIESRDVWDHILADCIAIDFGRDE